MPQQYIIAHDMGTSGDKAVLVTLDGNIIDTARKNYPLHHPQYGYAEQNAKDWWQAVCHTTQEVLHKTGVHREQIAGLTFSSQVMSLVAIDQSGQPLMPVITWLDTRSARILKQRLWTPPRVQGFNIFRLWRFLRITGGAPGHNGKDQIAKILWLQAHQPQWFARVYKFLDAKDYIIYRLTGNFVTSVDIAYIWWLLDTRRKRNRWHPGLCRMAGIRPEQLAEVRESAAIAGTIHEAAAKACGLLAGTPVVNGAGDLSSAALGSGAIREGEMHIRIGTSGGVAGHFARRKIDLTHYTGCIGSTWPSRYYLGISHQETAGLCLEWLKNKVFGPPQNLSENNDANDQFRTFDTWVKEIPPGADGLMFTPWMHGERSPVNNDYIRAGFYNMGLNHSHAHMVRAVLEGIALNTRWAMETLEKLYKSVSELNVIGGGARSDIWCQIMADVTNRSIHQICDAQEASAKGVALLASMTLGYIQNYHDIKSYIKIKHTYQPDPTYRALYDARFKAFKQLYKQNHRWHARMNRRVNS
ncbi:MAG: hypothetical protein GF313_10860 [Caldithrix sp.]|nr:hypothetical protein [Caldithrix sp.]